MKTPGKRSLLSIPYTKRDILILYAVFVIRYMTTTQIWRLFFSHTSSLVCNQRLKKLVDYGLLRVIEQATVRGTGRKPNIYTLARLGGELLVYECGIPPKFINTTPFSDEAYNLKIKHTLAATGCLIAIKEASELSGFTLEAWEMEREIRNRLTKETVRFVGPDGQQYRTPIPDLLFTLKRDEKRALCWLEVDRATENIELSPFERQSISAKILEFMMWEQTEYFRTEYRSETSIRPLRVLFITTGERRMTNMKTAAEKVIGQQLMARNDLSEAEKKAELVRIGKRFRFLTFDQLHAETLLTQPVWAVAGSDVLQTILE